MPTLRHLAYFCAVTNAPVTGLESGGDLCGEAEEGDTQGDPAASMRFCVGLQSSLVTLGAACSQGGGMARAGADDVIAIGPADVVLPAVHEFAGRYRSVASSTGRGPSRRQLLGRETCLLAPLWVSSWQERWLTDF